MGAKVELGCSTGAGRRWLPPLPYSFANVRLLKRSRSDHGEVLMGPTLRSILGSRCSCLCFPAVAIVGEQVICPTNTLISSSNGAGHAHMKQGAFPAKAAVG